MKLMLNGLLITNERLDRTSGAGSVVNHAMKAMAKVYEKCRALDYPTIIPDGIQIPYDPFMLDYVCSEKIHESGVIADLVHFNGAPFIKTLRSLRDNHPNIRVISDCAPHNVAISIEEFEKVLGYYPNAHVKNPYMFSLFMRHIANSDVVVVPSEAGKKYLESIGITTDMEVIPHGTEIPEYIHPDLDNFRVGYLGRAGPDKGLRYLFGAWSGFSGVGELHLTGKGLTDDTKNYVETLVNLAGTRKIVVNEFQYDKWAYLSSLSVYVQPSVTEGFGIPALEAMAAGRPVIVTEGAGMAELVRDGIDGYVVPIRDAKAIHSCILELYDHPEKRIEMGNNARETAMKYTWDKIEDKYVKLYKELSN